MKFKAKNLLVTGGAGFIGSNFIKHIFNKYEDVKIFNLDVLTYAGNLNNTSSFKKNPNYNFIRGNICDKYLVSEIFEKFQIDGVINFAAESHVDNSIENPSPFIETNINGVFNLLNIAFKSWNDGPFNVKKKFRHAKFHQVSTDEVFGSIENGSSKESDQFKPNSPYSSSKASGDLLVRSFFKTYGLNTSVSHSSNNFGNNQHSEKFIPKIITSIIKDIPISVYGDGKNIRDWIAVEENCSAIDLIFSNSKPGSTYNIGGKNEISNLDLIELIFELMPLSIRSSELRINFVNDRFGHDKRYSLNINKIKKELNWTPSSNFRDHLKKYINSYE